jgi:hypothetical protein
LAYGKGAVAVLPGEFRKKAAFGFDPLGGISFGLSDDFRNCMVPRKRTEDMHMVLNSANHERR